jgi:hypothetical protein
MGTKFFCGAKLRQGGTCKRAVALPGVRCPRHGGARTGHHPSNEIRRPEKSLARGLYTDLLFPWEEDVYATCKTGTLEEELKLLRIQLRRAAIAQKNYEIVMDALGEWREDPDNVEVPPELFALLEIDTYEWHKSTEDHKTSEVRKMLRRKRDYQREIRQWVGLIAKLEAVHKELLKSELFGVDTLGRMADDLRQYTQNAISTMGVEL